MNINELFIDGHKLPKTLSKQEVYELLDKIKQGDEQAIAKLAEHNIKLVLSQVTSKFKTVEYDKKDLVSIGNIGLMKAILTFDTSKKVEFSTYAIRCIDNEILMFLRKLKKYANDDSFDRIINHDKDGNELKIEDTLSDDTDIVEEYIDNEMHLIIRQIVKELPERDRKITMLYFGFYNNKPHTQSEIANMLSISRSYVSRLISKIVKQIGEQLEEKGFIELKTKEKRTDSSKSKIKTEEKCKKTARKLKTIYQIFKDYTKEQVDATLEKLSSEEKALIITRYGEDLNNPVPSKLTKEQTTKFYSSLIPKLKRLLANPNKERKTNKKKTKYEETIINNLTDKSLNEIPVPKNGNDQLPQQIPAIGEIIKQQDTETITKDDCIKILELLRISNFNKMMDILSTKELVIIYLKLGYIDGKYFSTTAISQFLGIEKQEVIDATKKLLLMYKENINQFIDNTIQIITDKHDTTISLQKK